MSKEEIIELIESSGCKMLKGKLDGDETKEQIVAYLKKCNCPIIKSYL
jgi:hypothetical protein